MCCKGFRKKIVPFIMAFSLSLLINSLFVENYSRNDFKLNIEQPITKALFDGSSKNQAIKILQMPEAEYTNQAKDNYVVGVVRLKVNFLANGQVGNIKVIDKVSYGLTASAIQAAKKIKFEPANLDDKPINVNLTIEYSFAPYGQQIAIVNSDYSEHFVWNSEKRTFSLQKFDTKKTSLR